MLKSCISKRTVSLADHPHTGPRERRTNLQKLEMIKWIKENKSTNSQAANYFRVSESFIAKLLKDEGNIIGVCLSNSTWKHRSILKYKMPLMNIEQKTIEQIDKINHSNTGAVVTIQAIRLIALNMKRNILLSLQDDICHEVLRNFKVTNGWIYRFEKRNNIHQYHNFGIEKSVDIMTIRDKMDSIAKRLQYIDPTCILNIDETGLFFQSNQTHSIQRIDDSRHSVSQSKKRITVTVVTSKAGERFPLQIIHCSAKPRCFKGTDIEQTYNIYYSVQKRSWQDAETFSTLLHKINKIANERGVIIYILLDNAPSHIKGAKEIGCVGNVDTELRFGNIILIFLPANSTSITQPNDRGIISKFKRKYRSHQLLDYIEYLNSTNFNPKQTLIEFSTLDKTFEWLKLSWASMKSEDIRNCWNNAFDRFTHKENNNPHIDFGDSKNYPKYNEYGCMIEI